MPKRQHLTHCALICNIERKKDTQMHCLDTVIHVNIYMHMFAFHCRNFAVGMCSKLSAPNFIKSEMRVLKSEQVDKSFITDKLLTLVTN